MSLTAILRKIDKLDIKQRQIELRFNSTSKGCPRQAELQQQSQEDQRIFGYSGSQILTLFKHSRKPTAEQTRPCTATLLKPPSPDAHHPCIPKRSHLHRVHSATKSVAVGYKEQYNFLFKEDIFDDNWRSRKSLPCEEDTRREQLVRKLRGEGPEMRVQSWSIQKEKKKFIKSFEENIAMLKQESKVMLAKRFKSKVVYQRRPVQKQSAQAKDDLFRLTRAEFDCSAPRSRAAFTNCPANLRTIRRMLNADETTQFGSLVSANKGTLPFSNFWQTLLLMLPERCVLTVVGVPSLASLEVGLRKAQDELVVDQTKERIEMDKLVAALLAEHGFIHLCFHAEGALLYELFALAGNLTLSKTTENEILLLSYYLKRFLMLDGVTSSQAAHESTELVFKSNLDIPDEFIDFVGALGNKVCHFYDGQRRYYTMRLREVLSSGVRRLQGFKKELGLGQKVVKLKHGNRREIKDKLYNWAYFYICFSLSLSPITQHLPPHTLTLLLPHASQTLPVLLHVPPSELPPQFPWNVPRTGLTSGGFCAGVGVGAAVEVFGLLGLLLGVDLVPDLAALLLAGFNLGEFGGVGVVGKTCEVDPDMVVGRVGCEFDPRPPLNLLPPLALTTYLQLPHLQLLQHLLLPLLHRPPHLPLDLLQPLQLLPQLLPPHSGLRLGYQCQTFKSPAKL